MQTEPHFGVTLLQRSLSYYVELWVYRFSSIICCREKYWYSFFEFKMLYFHEILSISPILWKSFWYCEVDTTINDLPKALLSKILRETLLPTSLKGNGVFWTPYFTCGHPDRAFARVYTCSSGQQPSSGALAWDSASWQVGRTKRLSRRSTCPRLPQPLQCVFSPHVTQVGPSPSRWPRITFGRGLGQTAETAAALAKSICRHESEP